MAKSWRLAKSLEQLRTQVDALSPHRDRSSDGTIGDTRHQATKSEHNPDANGVVRALDITNDPAHDVDAGKLAETLRQSREPRILYLISRGKIVSSKVSPWVWRPYTGVNGHFHHVHISVVPEAALFDDMRPWALTAAPPLLSQHATVTARTGLRLRSGPGPEFPFEKELAHGTLVWTGEVKGDWIMVDIEGDGKFDGYVHKAFLG